MGSKKKPEKVSTEEKTVKPTRVKTSVKALEGLTKVKHDMKKAIDEVESPSFKASLNLSYAAFAKKVDSVTVNIKNAEQLTSIRKALAEGKKVIIQEE